MMMILCDELELKNIVNMKHRVKPNRQAPTNGTGTERK